MTQDFAIQRTASLEQRVDADRRRRSMRAGSRPREAVEELGHMAQEEWVPRNGARVVAKAWTDPAFRQRLLADGRAAVAELGLRDAGAPPPPRRAREHADGAERHLLHAVLVHRVHDHRPAAGLVQGPRVPLARRARVAHGAEGDGARPCRRTSRSASGTPPPTRATWCCRCGRRETAGWPEEQLAGIVTRDSMIGVARL